MGSSGGTTTTTSASNTEPWSVQQPYLEGLFSQASDMYQNEAYWPQYYPSSTVVGMYPAQSAALTQMENYGAAGGSPTLQQGQSTLQNILGNSTSLTQPTMQQAQGVWGDYMSGNNGLNMTSPTYAMGQNALQNALLGYDQAITQPTFAAGQGALQNAINTSNYAQDASMPAYMAAQGALTNQLSGGALATAQPDYNLANAALSGEIAGGNAQATAPAYGATQNYWTNMINGSTLNPWTSPGFQSVVDQTLANTIPQTTASFIGGGRTDSGLAQRAASEGATSAVGQLAFNQYNAQQQLQAQAAQQAASQMVAQQQLQQNATQMGINQYAAQQGLNLTGAQIAGQQLAQQQGAGTTAAQVAGQQLNAQQQLVQNAAQLAGQQYQGEQGYQQSAAQQGQQGYLGQLSDVINAANAVPGLESSQQSAMGLGYQSGAEEQAQAQQQLTDYVNRVYYNEELPWNMLSLYQNAVGTNYGSSTQGYNQSPYYSNTASNVIGGVAGAASIGASIAAIV